MRAWFSFAAALVLFFGCAGPEQRRPPSSVDQGALIIRLSFKGKELPNLRTHWADQVFWARLNSYGDFDLDHPIATNFAENGNAYALDVPPGRYAPIAASYLSLGLRFSIRIEDSVRRQAIVNLKSGGIVFAGELSLRTEWNGFLAGMGHLFARLRPFSHPLIDVSDDINSPILDQDPIIEAEALRIARRDLAGTSWGERIQARLSEIGNPPRPILHGLFKPKAVLATEAGRFAYIDTLDWGRPRKVPGGLEWNEPKGKARVLIAFVDEATGGKPREKALAEMRDSGSAEDAHVLSDVSVKGRPARKAFFTTYVYPKDAIAGGEPQTIWKTQVFLLPDPKGYYFIVYRAKRDKFEDLRPDFEKFIQYLELRAPPKARF